MSFPGRGLVLAIDIGTSSSRSALHDRRGERLPDSTAQSAYPLQTGADGRAELRPADLRRAFLKIVGSTLAARSTNRPLVGIGVSCFWHSMIGLDAVGRPLTPIYTWADSRCRSDAAALRKGSGERALHRRTGCMARASFWPARLLWLRRTDPALFRRVIRWVSPAEWLQEEVCGASSASLSMASGTGLLDARTLRWDLPLLARCGLIPARLNPLSDASTPVAKGELVRRHPELRGVPWFPALGDGAASNLGSGATVSGTAAINVGTSAALRVVIDQAASPGARKNPAPYGLFGYRIDRRRRLIGGAASNAGNLRAWALRELALPSEAALEKALEARVLPVPGLTMLPFWIAERAPTWPEEMPSAIVGVTQATTALDLLQTLMEGTYHRLGMIADAVEKSLGRHLIYIVSGGISHSPASLQRLADVLGRPVRAAIEPEASLRGAAIFALERLGSVPALPRVGKVIRPRPAACRAHAVVRLRQQQLETHLRNIPFPS